MHNNYFMSLLNRECRCVAFMMKLLIFIGLFKVCSLNKSSISTLSNRDCLRLCFMHIIQRELNTLVHEWNTHQLRPTRNCSVPAGIPDELFFLPQVQGMMCRRIVTCDVHSFISYNLRICQLPVSSKQQGPSCLPTVL